MYNKIYLEFLIEIKLQYKIIVYNVIVRVDYSSQRIEDRKIDKFKTNLTRSYV